MRARGWPFKPAMPRPPKTRIDPPAASSAPAGSRTADLPIRIQSPNPASQWRPGTVVRARMEKNTENETTVGAEERTTASILNRA